VLTSFPREQPNVTGVGTVQRQVPADVRVADNKVCPQVTARGDLPGHCPQLGGRQPAGMLHQVLERIDDRLLPLRADAPARFQAVIDLIAPMRARSIWGDGGNRHETPLPADLLTAASILRVYQESAELGKSAAASTETAVGTGQKLCLPDVPVPARQRMFSDHRASHVGRLGT